MNFFEKNEEIFRETTSAQRILFSEIGLTKCIHFAIYPLIQPQIQTSPFYCLSFIYSPVSMYILTKGLVPGANNLSCHSVQFLVKKS